MDKLSIHFNSSGGIFNATFEPDGKSMPKDVPHLLKQRACESEIR